MKTQISILLVLGLFLISCYHDKHSEDKNMNKADYWSTYLSKEVKLKGIAGNAKMGAFIKTGETDAIIWIDSLDEWPDGFTGNTVQVTGVVTVRYDLPVFVQKKGEPEKSGVPVPEGTDLHEESKRYLLKNATWQK